LMALRRGTDPVKEGTFRKMSQTRGRDPYFFEGKRNLGEEEKESQARLTVEGQFANKYCEPVYDSLPREICVKRIYDSWENGKKAPCPWQKKKIPRQREEYDFEKRSASRLIGSRKKRVRDSKRSLTKAKREEHDNWLKGPMIRTIRSGKTVSEQNEKSTDADKIVK